MRTTSSSGKSKPRSRQKPNQKLQAWIDARKRHHLSHAQVQMARELGMNPAKLGKLDSHDQGPWKTPLTEYIEHLYRERFGRPRPEAAMPIEDRWRLQEQKKEARRVARRPLAMKTP